ncbi:hypothetical protein BX264_0106 [Streptomyces sp. 2333.5]|nr:hypothetical protein BX264_0106 [Streptomyces sp. 2333.5]SEC44316.1 hypothetical protein SAMN05428942_0105 [Streptomyces sp. 2112.2]
MVNDTESAHAIEPNRSGVPGSWWCVSDPVGDARHLSPSTQEALRLRTVAALVAGRDREDLASVFGVSLKAVDAGWAKWQTGTPALSSPGTCPPIGGPDPGGPGHPECPRGRSPLRDRPRRRETVPGRKRPRYRRRDRRTQPQDKGFVPQPKRGCAEDTGEPRSSIDPGPFVLPLGGVGEFLGRSFPNRPRTRRPSRPCRGHQPRASCARRSASGAAARPSGSSESLAGTYLPESRPEWGLSTALARGASTGGRRHSIRLTVSYPAARPAHSGRHETFALWS